MPEPTTELVALKNDIETFDRANQARALKILLDHNVPYDENGNGVFVNMANIPEEALVALRKYSGYVKLQHTFLETQEQEKEMLLQNYFKESSQGESC